MISIQGKGVSNGVALGPLYFYQRAKSTVTRTTVTDTEGEWARFKAAQAKAMDQLGELAEKARKEAGDEAALLFETHRRPVCRDVRIDGRPVHAGQVRRCQGCLVENHLNPLRSSPGRNRFTGSRHPGCR